MRVSREVAQENRQKVVDEAARLFRIHGYEGIGISGLMKAAGMTHGGFYKQFPDKTALMVEATQAAMAQHEKDWARRLEKAGGDRLEAFRQAYLHDTHLTRVAEGCVLPALAAEAPRHGEALQSAFAEGLEKLADLVAPEDRAVALSTIAQVVGALMLARAAGDHPVADQVIAAVGGKADEG